jgi:hypothetical protein
MQVSLLTTSFSRVVGVRSVTHPSKEVRMVRSNCAEDVVFEVKDAEARTDGKS